MNTLDLVPSTSPIPTMTSLEIAELTGKRHDNVKRDIAKLFSALEREQGDVLKSSLQNHQNQKVNFLEVPLKLAVSMVLTYLSRGSKQEYIDAVDKLLGSKFSTLMEIIEGLDVKDLPVDRFVYVAKEEFSGRYKVGISKHPEERVKQLNIGNPEHLVLVHAYLATEQGNLSEKLAHIALADKHLRSEWFDKDASLAVLPSYVEEPDD